MRTRRSSLPARRLSGSAALSARGFTFAEMLLVMALLLIIIGVVLPPVLRLMSDQPLKEGTERARQQLATVRVRALDSSVPWQFRFEPGGRRYLWMPQEADATGPVSSNGSSISDSTASTSVAGKLQTGELPQGITFATELNGSPFGVERLSQELLAGRSDSYQLSNTSWSTPLIFQADGSSSDFEFAVLDARDRQMRLSVRGLTGGLTVFPIEARSRR